MSRRPPPCGPASVRAPRRSAPGRARAPTDAHARVHRPGMTAGCGGPRRAGRGAERAPRTRRALPLRSSGAARRWKACALAQHKLCLRSSSTALGGCPDASVTRLIDASRMDGWVQSRATYQSDKPLCREGSTLQASCASADGRWCLFRCWRWCAACWAPRWPPRSRWRRRAWTRWARWSCAARWAPGSALCCRRPWRSTTPPPPLWRSSCQARPTLLSGVRRQAGP